MKLTALMLVRNEADILELNIRHHMRLGVDEFLVVDNGSADATPRILERLARTLPLRWRRSDGPFRQSEITTELAVEAHRRGAMWVLPTDADEFWWSQRPLRTVLGSTDAAALSVPVVNFVQRRRQRRPNTRSLRHMNRRAPVQIGPPEIAEELVTTHQIGFVEMQYSPKWVSRASPDLVIHRGNHFVSGVDGDARHSDELALLHAPLRAEAVLQSKAELGARADDGGFAPGEAWHARRWNRMDTAELAQEWAANSHRRGHLDVYGERRPLVLDDRLRDAVARRRLPLARFSGAQVGD